METLRIVLQLIVALGIYNVWLVRFNRVTRWRGGTARNMREEFAAYGLSPWVLHLIRILKLLCATGLIVGIGYPILTLPSAAGLTVLMLGAVTMHIKIHDPLRKALPALGMLLLSVAIVLLT